MSREGRFGIFDKHRDAAETWLDEVMGGLELEDPHAGYRVLRAALHALRDRLTADEAVNLGAQLPLLVRGIYFEGWKPSRTPERLRTRESFLERLGRELVPQADPAPEAAARAVFAVVGRHVSQGEVEDVRGMLPSEVKELWS